MYITGYIGLVEPISGRLPVQECIESLYDHVDEFVIADASKHDNLDLSKYGKVRKHVRTIFNCFDNPFGSLFTTALKLVNSDTALFIDADEIFEFKKTDLRSLAKQFPLESGAGIAFSLINYYCNRNYTIDGCSSKGPHLFRMTEDLYHDSLAGYWQHHNHIRRTNMKPDSNDGVRLCNGQGIPMNHFEPVSLDVVAIHHTSHLDAVGKFIRSLIQFNHTSVLDLKDFYPFDMRLDPELLSNITNIIEKEINNKEIELYAEPIPFEYKDIKLLNNFISRIGIKEFNPTEMKGYTKHKSQNENCASCLCDTSRGTATDFVISS